MLFSPESGKMIAVMDGSYITAIRTACASAMASKVLSNPTASVLGVLGAGVQAKAHITALSRVRNLHSIKIYSPSGTSAGRVKQELESELGIDIEVAKSAEEAVRGADLIVTATTAKEPILQAEWLKPGAHINAVGSHRPDLRELDGATLARSNVFVDSRDAIMAECGDVLLALAEKSITADHVQAEIGEVLAATKPGRTKPDELTIYKSVGIAIQDVATAGLVYHKALERNLGTHISL
jgi:ornithine cyclodeaminase/alanine dehydrogenase-like protein (mu-crystallin family)